MEGRYHEVGKKIPVRIISGKEDEWVPVETATRLQKKLTAQDVVVIEGAGHLIMYDQPGRLGIDLGCWLSKVEQK